MYGIKPVRFVKAPETARPDEIDRAALIDDLTARIILMAGNVNFYLDRGDKERNRTNYGCVSEAARILRLLDVSSEIAIRDIDGYLKIEKIIIAGKQRSV